MRPEHWIYTVPLRLRSVFRRGKVEQELDEELRYHVESRIEEEIAQGRTPEQARQTALRAMQGVEQQKERCRDARGVSFIENVLRDLRYAVRVLRKDAGFTAVAVCCLALGIGANTAIFSLMNAVLLKSLPVKNPAELAVLKYDSKKPMRDGIMSSMSGYGSYSLPYGTLTYLRQHSRTLANVFGFVPLGFDRQNVAVNVNGEASFASGQMVTGEFFSGLGVSPVLGRALTESDEKPDAPRAVVISYDYWTNQFGRDPSAIGRTITLNHVPFTIAGVTPPEFFGVDPQRRYDLWIPLRDEPGLLPWGVQQSESIFGEPRRWWLMVMARRRPGVTSEQAQAETNVLFHQSITAGLGSSAKTADLPRMDLVPGAGGLQFLRRSFSKALWILTAAAGLVLLIACANVAALLLARAAARRREMSIRLATGASRGCLIRQLLTESMLLAGCGGALGLAFATWGSRALLLLMSGRAQAMALDVGPDGMVLAFCAVLSMLTGILFGLAPAFSATRLDLARALKENSNSVSRRLGLGGVLVAGQVAFSVLLLIGAGLFLRTLGNLLNQDLGFDRHNLLVFSLNARRTGATQKDIFAAYQQALESIQAVPGVRSATASQIGLLTGWVNNGPISTDGPKLPAGQSNQILWNGVGPSFFQTMGIGLMLGRGFEWRDYGKRGRVAVINEGAARQFFPSMNPIGHHFVFGQGRPEDGFEIIGVVRNAKYNSLQSKAEPTAYVAYGPGGLTSLYFGVRTAGDPASLVPAIRQALRSIDAEMIPKDIKTQSEQIDDSVQQERMFARLSGFFALLALLLVVVGLYGILAHSVARRTNEIGIRMALGAQRFDVVWMALRQSLLLVVSGAAIGVALSLGLTRFIESQLYGVKPNDAATILATVLILLGVGAFSAYLPARRAARVEPTVALRYE